MKKRIWKSIRTKTGDLYLLKFRLQRSAWSMALWLIPAQSAVQWSSRSMISSVSLDSKCSESLLKKKAFSTLSILSTVAPTLNTSPLKLRCLFLPAAAYKNIFFLNNQGGRTARSHFKCCGLFVCFEFRASTFGAATVWHKLPDGSKNNRRSRGQTSPATVRSVSSSCVEGCGMSSSHRSLKSVSRRSTVSPVH